MKLDKEDRERFTEAMRVCVCLFSFLLLLGLSACDFAKPKNTTPKPPPAPKKKEAVSKSKEEAKPTQADLAPKNTVVEWEGLGTEPLMAQFNGIDLGVILYYTPECEPSKKMKELLEGFSYNKGKNFKMVCVNANFFPQLAKETHLEATPKVVIVKNRSVVGAFVGAISEDKWNTIIKNLQESS